MTLISLWNSRLFRTALTALTEPFTLWWRITGCTCPGRRVTLHTYLMYGVVTYTYHQNNTCVTLIAGAAVMLMQFAHCMAMCIHFSGPVPNFTSPVVAIYRMPHSPQRRLVLRYCHLLHCSLRCGFITCRCICFAITVFYRSEIYCPIFTLSSTMPSPVPVWACNIQCVALIQHTSFKISFLRASNAMDQILLRCIAVFLYVSIICRCGASPNGFATHRVP